MDNIEVFIYGFLAGAASIGFLGAVAVCLPSWTRSWSCNANIGLMQIVGMRLRRHPPRLMLDAYIALFNRGHKKSGRLMAMVESAYAASARRDITAEELAGLVEERIKSEGSEI